MKRKSGYTLMRFAKAGFSLIELLVAMGLAAMVFILTSAVLITVISANSKSQRLEAFEQVKNNLGMELSGVIRWGSDVKVVSNEIEADGVVYREDAGRIYKNDKPITPADVEVTGWQVEDNSNRPGWVSVVIGAELANKQDVLAHDVLRVVVSQRKQEVGYGQ